MSDSMWTWGIALFPKKWEKNPTLSLSASLEICHPRTAVLVALNAETVYDIFFCNRGAAIVIFIVTFLSLSFQPFSSDIVIDIYLHIYQIHVLPPNTKPNW